MEGLTTIQSKVGAQETMDRLVAEIKTHGMTVFARIDHSTLAKEAGLTLLPTEVILFGNPRGGTPLMQAKQTIGIDLPLKALVWQDAAGKTWLSYNEPAWLASRHQVAGADQAIDAMRRALEDVAAKATGATAQERLQGEPATRTTNVCSGEDGAVGPPNAVELNQSNRVPQTPDVEPPKATANSRLLAIGVVVAGISGVFAYAGGWLTPHELTPKKIVDTFQLVNGKHPGFRRNHAKGVCISGYFDSNGQGAVISKASVLRTGRVPVIGRFSLSGGQPSAADQPHTVRGLGLLFKPAGGEEWRTAMINLPVFPVRTPQAFYEQLLASAPDAVTGKPDPNKMEDFLARYPESAKAIQLIKSQPMSSGFENSTFNSLNAFRFIDAFGNATWVRWSMVPAQLFEPVTAAITKEADKNALFNELIASIHHHRLEWRLVITIAQPGDPTDDATLPWPRERKQVDVGTLVVERAESDETSPARDINFDPLVLPTGIAPSDDPLLSTRSAVYSRSFTRREGEQKPSSVVSVDEKGN
jgi:catalase